MKNGTKRSLWVKGGWLVKPPTTLDGQLTITSSGLTVRKALSAHLTAPAEPPSITNLFVTQAVRFEDLIEDVFRAVCFKVHTGAWEPLKKTRIKPKRVVIVKETVREIVRLAEKSPSTEAADTETKEALSSWLEDVKEQTKTKEPMRIVSKAEAARRQLKTKGETVDAEGQ